MTQEQQDKLRQKWEQNSQGISFDEFLGTTYPEIAGTAIMVPWCGMILGIERNGYCHS